VSEQPSSNPAIGLHVPGQGWVPVPDPTKLTTEQLRRELDIMAAELRRESEANRALLMGDILHLRELHAERFDAIDMRFHERDVRFDQEKDARKEAIAAALLAQKELIDQQTVSNALATGKSEAGFTKQIDQIGLLLDGMEKSITERITELKERIDRGEGSSSGSDSAVVSRRENDVLQQMERSSAGQQIRSTAAIGVALLSVVVTIVLALIVIAHK
jgi:hypothetical protein